MPQRTVGGGDPLLVLDGRGVCAPDRPHGCFIGPTVFDDVTPDLFVGREEIFGPVVGVVRAKDLGEAIASVVSGNKA